MTRLLRSAQSLIPHLLLFSTLAITGCAAFRPTADDPALLTDVFFITNRADREPTESRPDYGGARGPVSKGVCSVRFRPMHANGESSDAEGLPEPIRLRAVRRVSRMDAPEFDERLRADAAGPVVLFVHGYADSFDRACRRAAQLQRRFGDRATVVLFTWPSDGNPLDYVSDLADSEWAGLDLAERLPGLARAVGRDHLRVVAHSLGARLVMEALLQIRLRRNGLSTPLADHLVLLAPDVDRGTFETRWPLVAPMLRNTTLYASENDVPLGASARLNDQPRLGQAGESLTLLDGIQTIDLSPLRRRQIFGHEYYRSHPVVVRDLETLLLAQPDAALRPLPIARTHPSGQRYYELVDRERPRDRAR